MILDERLELGSTRNGHVQGLGREEALRIEQIEEVAVYQIGQQLVGQPIERGHLRQRQIPLPVRGSIDKPVLVKFDQIKFIQM